MGHSDTELWPYENFDTEQMLHHFKSEAEKIVFQEDPNLPPMSEAMQQHLGMLENKLVDGLS